MNNEDILKENNGKKWDIILSNPPYSEKNTGDGLYVKFLNKYCNICKGNIISINPDNGIVGHQSGSTAKKEFQKIRNFMDEHYINIETINSNVFKDAGIKSGIVIINIDFNKDHNIIYTNKSITLVDIIDNNDYKVAKKIDFYENSKYGQKARVLF